MALSRIAKAGRPWLRVQTVGWRSGRVGVAQATGKCAIVHNLEFQVWSGPARLVDLEEPAPANAGGWGTPIGATWVGGGFGGAHNDQAHGEPWRAPA